MVGFILSLATLLVGIGIGYLIKALRVRRQEGGYSGTIFVSKAAGSEKTVYSLELDDYPETLRFKKVVVFKVDNKRNRR